MKRLPARRQRPRKKRPRPRKQPRERQRDKQMDRPSLSIGIEEEYQTIDPETRDLRSHIASEILPKAKRALHEAVKPEMHQAVIEVGTKVCRDIKEARADILALRREMITLASENGLLLAAASTHPFADWKVQEIYPDERYRQVIEEMQMIARANLVFGLHVHVGIEDRNTAIHIMNSMRYFLPHILALSTQLAFLDGHADRLQVVSQQSFRALSAHRHSRRLRQLGRLRDLRQPAGQDRLHRQRQENLVGHPPASVLQHAGSAGVRHPHAAGRDHGHRRADPGDGRHALQAACIQQELPHLRPRADHGEQVPRLALRARRHAD